jgi:hypothetical protein
MFSSFASSALNPIRSLFRYRKRSTVGRFEILFKIGRSCWRHDRPPTEVVMTPANSHALRDCAQKFQFCPLWASVQQDGADSCSITRLEGDWKRNDRATRSTRLANSTIRTELLAQMPSPFFLSPEYDYAPVYCRGVIDSISFRPGCTPAAGRPTFQSHRRGQ